MKLYEFVGLPGCGKTTICHQLEKSLKEEGLIIYTYSDMVRLVKTRMRRILFLLYLVFRPCLWDYARSLTRYSSNYSKVSLGSLYVIVAMVDFCLRKKNSQGLIVADEGFVQNITSIAHLYPIIKDETYYGLCGQINEIVDINVINCRIDIEKDIVRLRTRNSGDRFNSIKDNNKLTGALVIKQRNIDEVLKEFKMVDKIDMNCETSQLFNQLCHLEMKYEND